MQPYSVIKVQNNEKILTKNRQSKGYKKRKRMINKRNGYKSGISYSLKRRRLIRNFRIVNINKKTEKNVSESNRSTTKKQTQEFMSAFRFFFYFSKNFFIASKLSLLKSCSMRQASSVAIASSTPRLMSQEESTRWRSYMVSAISRPRSVK